MGRSCFSVGTTPLTWGDAVTSCARNNGTLTSLESREEAHFVASLLTSKRRVSKLKGAMSRYFSIFVTNRIVLKGTWAEKHF